MRKINDAFVATKDFLTNSVFQQTSFAEEDEKKIRDKVCQMAGKEFDDPEEKKKFTDDIIKSAASRMVDSGAVKCADIPPEALKEIMSIFIKGALLDPELKNSKNPNIRSLAKSVEAHTTIEIQQRASGFEPAKANGNAYNAHGESATKSIEQAPSLKQGKRS